MKNFNHEPHEQTRKKKPQEFIMFVRFVWFVVRKQNELHEYYLEEI